MGGIPVPRVLLPILMLVPLVLAGCLEGPTGTPEERAAVSVARFLDDLAPEGEIRGIHGTADANGARLNVELTLGAEGAGRLTAVMGGALSFGYVCTPERAFLTWGGETREMRPTIPCAEALAMPERAFGADGRGPPTPMLMLANATVVHAVDEDGYLTATYRPAETSLEGLVVTATMDSLDRIQTVRVDTPEGTGEFTIEYGERRPLALPEAPARIPSEVDAGETFRPGEYAWSAMSGDGAPLSEFEARVLDADGATVAVFPLTAPAAAAAGFTFRFHDEGDGTLGPGDRFTLANDAWRERGDYAVQVFDTWAQADVRDHQRMPAPGVLGVLAAVGLALLAARRR